MAYVSRLAGGLMHEIRNPLSTLNLNLQLLAEDLRHPASAEPDARRALKRIEALQRETNRLQEILDDFLRFARGHQLELAEHDLNKLVGEVVSFITPEARHQGIQVMTGYGNIPKCKLDSGLFKQALLNILINAQQAMPDGGDLMIRTSCDKEGVRLDVTDTGAGMSKEETDKAFEVYYSTKKSGTGLGLPTSKRIIEEHGGTISVHSEPGKGSVFSILLPASR